MVVLPPSSVVVTGLVVAIVGSLLLPLVALALVALATVALPLVALAPVSEPDSSPLGLGMVVEVLPVLPGVVPSRSRWQARYRTGSK